MDTAKGELSFVVNGVNLGVAYDGIPLDKPLVPCVLLGNKEDSVELDTSEVKETKVNSSIPVPSNITTKIITWDSITLSWDAVEGASFYQVEVDGNKFWNASTTNTFTKTGFLPETEHSFRVRAVCENEVSEWSGAVKRKTQKAPGFSECCTWKECSDRFGFNYSVNEMNPRVATKINDCGCCTVIGNIPLPLSKVTSWSIKILKSESISMMEEGIYIGVAPFGANKSEYYNYKSCGWCFHCNDSTLWSGPPHNYRKKEYGPRKSYYGEYVHKGESVGVVMDTAKGELSFVLNGMNLGVAFKGIPLDKPLVPCAVLGKEGNSVELII